MNVLYVGDIMGEPGIKTVAQVLPDLRRDKHIDLVIAQAENVTEGKGISRADFTHLKTLGIDFFTGGNHSLAQPEIIAAMEDSSQPIIRPANYPIGTPGKGWKYINTPAGRVLAISLLGQVVGRDADKPTDNPLRVIDGILHGQQDEPKIATIVNFHGDYSSEKVVIGHYLDGRVTAVIGDHWHVPTADVRVLPKGTAHITDVGMCGSLDSSLGVKLEVIINRWKTNTPSRNELETNGPRQFNAVLVDVDEVSGLARSVEQIRQII